MAPTTEPRLTFSGYLQPWKIFYLVDPALPTRKYSFLSKVQALLVCRHVHGWRSAPSSSVRRHAFSMFRPMTTRTCCAAASTARTLGRCAPNLRGGSMRRALATLVNSPFAACGRCGGHFLRTSYFFYSCAFPVFQEEPVRCIGSIRYIWLCL